MSARYAAVHVSARHGDDREEVGSVRRAGRQPRAELRNDSLGNTRHPIAILNGPLRVRGEATPFR